MFLPLARCPILIRTLETLAACDLIAEVVIAAAPEEVAQVEKMLQYWRTSLQLLPVRVVAGGAERQHSVANALAVLPEDTFLEDRQKRFQWEISFVSWRVAWRLQHVREQKVTVAARVLISAWLN